MAFDDTPAGARGKDKRDMSCLDLTRIRGLDPAACGILEPLIGTGEAAAPDLHLPFLLHLPDAAARAAFEALPPLEGHPGNGATVLGGAAAAALTGGAFLPVVAPVCWFLRLAGPEAESDRALSAFRDMEKSISLSAPATLPGWLRRLADKLPEVLPLGRPEGAGRFPPGTVVMGVIDDGIAIAHERFRHKDGTTRVEWYWDQNRQEVCEDRILGLRECGLGDLADLDLKGEIDKSRIDAVLAGVPPDQDEDLIYQRLGVSDFTLEDPDFVAGRVSHGTHVTDLAAGYDPEDEKAGLRPIIAVQLPNPVVGKPIDEQRLDFYIWLGICYVVLRADALAGPGKSLPVVINASFAKLAGPHDGSGLLEAAIHRLVVDRKQRVQIIMPSGNQHLSQCHATATLGPDEEVEIDWEVMPDDRTLSTVQLWLPETETARGPRLELTLRTPYGSTTVFDDTMSAAVPIRHLGKDAGRIRREASSRGRRMIRIDIGPTAPDLHKPSDFDIAPSGTWKICLRGGSAGSGGPVHLWSQRDDTLPGYPDAGRQSHFAHATYRRVAERLHPGEPGGDLMMIDSDRHPEQRDRAAPITRTHLLNAFAAGDQVLVAGGHVAETGRIAPFSAGGPTTPGNPSEPPASKPDATFPCDRSVLRRGILAAGSRSGAVAALSGTSVAAPQFARLVADCLGGTRREKLELIGRIFADAARDARETGSYSLPVPAERSGLGRLSRPDAGPLAGLASAESP